MMIIFPLLGHLNDVTHGDGEKTLCWYYFTEKTSSPASHIASENDESFGKKLVMKDNPLSKNFCNLKKSVSLYFCVLTVMFSTPMFPFPHIQ